VAESLYPSGSSACSRCSRDCVSAGFRWLVFNGERRRRSRHAAHPRVRASDLFSGNAFKVRPTCRIAQHHLDPTVAGCRSSRRA